MLLTELCIIECDLKNQRFQHDDSSQTLLVESPNLLYILTALLPMALGLAGHLLQSLKADPRI